MATGLSTVEGTRGGALSSVTSVDDQSPVSRNKGTSLKLGRTYTSINTSARK